MINSKFKCHVTLDLLEESKVFKISPKKEENVDINMCLRLLTKY